MKPKLNPIPVGMLLAAGTAGSGHPIVSRQQGASGQRSQGWWVRSSGVARSLLPPSEVVWITV